MPARSGAAALFMVVWTAVAAAEPHVVIVETADAPALSALATQVQMHANRPIRVSTVEAPETSAAFAARASQVVVEHDATIVVWVGGSPEDADRTLLVFAAGRWPDRALIELVRIRAGTTPAEIERTVALKVTSLLDTATSPRPIAASLGVPVLRPRAGRVWRLEVGGAAVRESGARAWDPRFELAIDHGWRRSASTLALGLGVHYQPASTIDDRAGVVSVHELGASLAIAAERSWGAWSAFARPRALVNVLLADGASPRGLRGSATVLSPSFALELGVRWHVSETLAVVAGAGIEAAWYEQRFLVDGVVVADLGRVRARAGVGISYALP